MTLYIIDPSNLSEKHKLEHKLQKLYHSQFKDIEIKYIPSKFPQYNFFNKFFSLIDYFKDKEIQEQSFYTDHDIFIMHKQMVSNLFNKKIFLNCKIEQKFDWNKLFYEKLNLKINTNFNQRFLSCFFPLYKNFLDDLENELKIFYEKKDFFILYSGLFEEYFFTKVILQNNYKTIDIQKNKEEFLYIMHYQILEKFKFKLLKIDKNCKNTIRKLEKIYKEKE